MNKNLLILGKNNFITNNLDTKINENKINCYYEKERIDKQDLYLISDLFCKKYFFYEGITFHSILVTLHFHNDNNLKNNSNILLAKHVSYFSKIHDSAKIIYISSVQASKLCINKYAIDKLNTEKIYSKSNNFLIIRPSTILEKRDGIIYGGYKGKTVKNISNFIKRFNFFSVANRGEYQHTYCIIDSLTNFILEVINKNIFKNEKINFFSGEYLTYIEFLAKISFHLNRNPKYIFIPINIFKLILSLLFMKNEIKQIDNLLLEKIEYDKIDQITKYMKLETL